MTEDTKTMVMVALPHTVSPIQPHVPGAFVLGYVAGNQDEAEDYLNRKKIDKKNALLKNAWLLQCNSGFERDVKLPPNIDPSDERNRALVQQLVKNAPRLVKHTFDITGLSSMDSTNGISYSVPLENTYWVYPANTMIQDLEAKIAHHSRTLAERSNITVSSPNSGLKIR